MISSHTCQAIVVTCIDFRLQKFISDWTKKINGGFDRLSITGGVKNLPFVLEQIALSHKLHHIKEVYLINHQDCGAYAEEGTLDRHKKDLLYAQKSIKQKYPKLKIIPLFLKLKGEFIKV